MKNNNEKMNTEAKTVEPQRENEDFLSELKIAIKEFFIANVREKDGGLLVKLLGGEKHFITVEKI